MERNKAIMLLAGIALFLISLFFDQQLLNYVSNLENSFFDAFFSWITNFVNVFVILVVVTTLFLIEEKKREWVFPLWISFGAAVVIAFLLKLIIARPRPAEPIFYSLIDTVSYSLPSMHAMVAFSLAPLLSREFPKLKWFWFLFAFLVAFSRVYFEYHFVSDVILGGVLGYFVGILVIHVEKKYGFFRFLK